MNLQKVLTFFPPPTFIDRPSIGLDITDEAVYFAELRRGKNGFELGKYGEKILPRGMVEAGHINDPEGLSNILKELKDRHGFQNVRTSLPEEKTYLFSTEIPYTDDISQMKKSLEFKLEDNVPIPPAETIFEFDLVSNLGIVKDHLDVSVLAVSDKVVSAYTSVLHSAGLNPFSFEVETRALAKAVVRKGDDSTIMIIDVGNLKTGVYVISEGVVRFSSTLNLDIRQETFDENRDTTAMLALRAEIQRIQTYWNTHNDKNNEFNVKIEKVLICGQPAIGLKLDHYFSRKLQLPVEFANIWSNVCSFDSYIPVLDFNESLKYAVAVGLILSQYHNF